jgi:hypothetical protein
MSKASELVEAQTRQIQEVREAAARQEQQIRLHPAAGFVEIEVKEGRLDIFPRRVFVSITTWEVVFASLLQLRLQLAGVKSELTQLPPA